MKTATEYTHTPVLINETLHGLNLQADGIYIDCTFGRGGHSKAILQQLNEQGRLFAIDKDPDAVTSLDASLSNDKRFSLHHGSFTMLGKLLEEKNLMGCINGILLDLGVSSPQFDDSTRGFSFQKDAELDMRMDNRTGLSAADWINSADQQEIIEILFKYGEEKYAKKIARSIIKEREIKPITRTHQLANLIISAVPRREKGKHPATRTFQAIRIMINNEVSELQNVLSQTVGALTNGGRLLVISFHSLEDRIVKRFIRENSRGDTVPIEVPVTANYFKPKFKKIGKAIHPSQEEINQNPRSRSAVLRIAERICT